MFRQGFEYQIMLAKERLIKKKSLQDDLARFLIMVLIVMLIGVLNRSHQIIQMIEWKPIIKETTITKLQAKEQLSPVSILSENYWLRQIDDVWAEMGGNDSRMLGRNDSQRDGWFGSFSGSGVNMIVFLPQSFENAISFTKNGSSLLLEPLGYNPDNSWPEIEGDKLIYDEIYPGIMIVRMFKQLGLKEYIIVKNQESIQNWFTKLNYQGGNMELLSSGQIRFLDENGHKKFEMGKLIGLDASGNKIDDNIEQRLIEGNILEIKLVDTGALNYPLLIDPEVY